MNNLSVRSPQSLLLLFYDKRDDFVNKNEEFYNSIINKISVMIKGISLQLYRAGLEAKDIYPELKNIFTKKTLM